MTAVTSGFSQVSVQRADANLGHRRYVTTDEDIHRSIVFAAAAHVAATGTAEGGCPHVACGGLQDGCSSLRSGITLSVVCGKEPLRQPE